MFHTFVCYLHVHCFVNQKLNIKLIGFVEVYSEINSNLLDEKFYFFNSRSIESILRRSAGQQITHQTCLKLLYMSFLFSQKQSKEKFQIFELQIWNNILHLFTELFRLKKINIALKWPRQSSPLKSTICQTPAKEQPFDHVLFHYV